jgi:NAD(P)-dependent dehydrogenase (short-subunit alcohol dehydrogenase family)
MTDPLTDLVVVVTGASSGIGEATARLRALRTGEARIDIPHGPEQPDFPDAD